MPLALATCRSLPRLDVDDQLLHQALQAAGVETEIVIWDDPDIDWGRYNMVVIRSTWDYVPVREAYLAWAERVSAKSRIWNSPALLRWNTDKHYLRDLEAAGIPIVPTLWGAAGTLMTDLQLPQEAIWGELVAKPAISASGNDTYKITRVDWTAGSPELQALLAERDMMVQPFMRTIQTVGEYAFLFFNGEFSHAVLKRPRAGAFLVQEHHGGRNERIQPSAGQLQFAENVIGKLPEQTLYARVDAIEDETGQLRVSEVELTEPSTYLAQDESAPARFAAAIQQRLQATHPLRQAEIELYHL